MAAVARAIPIDEGQGPRDRLHSIIATQSLRKGHFKLASGKMSSYFFDMKKAMLEPEGANLIADEILNILRNEDVQMIGGLEMGAVPIVSIVCAKSWQTETPVKGFFVRKTQKGHGTDLPIDGHILPGGRAILVDDVTTTGSSVLKAINAAREHGCIVEKVITIVDRQEGAMQALYDADVALIPLFTRADFD